MQTVEALRCLLLVSLVNFRCCYPERAAAPRPLPCRVIQPLATNSSVPKLTSGHELVQTTVYSRYSLPSSLLFASHSMPRHFKHSSKLLPRYLHELLQRRKMRAISQRYQLRDGWNRSYPIGCSALGEDFVSQFY